MLCPSMLTETFEAAVSIGLSGDCRFEKSTERTCGASVASGRSVAKETSAYSLYSLDRPVR